MEPNQSSEPNQDDCPRAHLVCLKTVARIRGSSKKPLDFYSLTVNQRGRQQVASNGHNRGLNGNPSQRTAIIRVLKDVTNGANGLPACSKIARYFGCGHPTCRALTR